MKNRSHIYNFFIGLVIILNSCTNQIEFNGNINENENLTKWIKKKYANITNSNELLEKDLCIIKDNKIIKRTIEYYILDQITEISFIYENELLKSKVQIINNSLKTKFTYAYNSNNELIEQLSVDEYGSTLENYHKTLYSHNGNFVDITHLISNNGIDYEPSNNIISAKLNFDVDDNLIQREIFHKGYFGMEDYYEITDFTYDIGLNLITTNPSFYESCTYSNIKSPVELIYSSTYGRKNFQLLNYLGIYPLLGNSISKNMLETFKRSTNTNNEIVNNLDLNGMLSKHTIFESYEFNDRVYQTTHEFIYE